MDTYIGCVTDELTKEDLFVAVERIDNQAQELIDLRLKSEGLNVSPVNLSHWQSNYRLRKILRAMRWTVSALCASANDEFFIGPIVREAKDGCDYIVEGEVLGASLPTSYCYVLESVLAGSTRVFRFCI